LKFDAARQTSSPARDPKLAAWYKEFAEMSGIKATQPPAA